MIDHNKESSSEDVSTPFSKSKEGDADLKDMNSTSKTEEDYLCEGYLPYTEFIVFVWFHVGSENFMFFFNEIRFVFQYFSFKSYWIFNKNVYR